MKFLSASILVLVFNCATAQSDEFVPEFIGDMQSIKVLNLEKNKFDRLPIELCRMKNVERVIINRNELSTLPSCIEYLVSLKYIDLYDNPIRKLPESEIIKTLIGNSI